MNDDTQLLRPVGERRARREAERKILADTGQQPVVDAWQPRVPIQRPPLDGGRRARRLAEQSGAVVDHGSASLTSLTQLAELAHAVAALPAAAPGGDPLTWEEVFATGVGLAPGGAADGGTIPDAETWLASSAFDAAGGLRVSSGSAAHRRRFFGRVSLTPLKVVAVGLVAVALVAGSTVAIKNFVGDTESALPVAVQPHQRTMLVALQTSQASGSQAPKSFSLQSAAVLAVDDASGDAVSLLAPGSLVLDVPGAGRQPLATAVRSGANAPANALSDALEVRIDGSWLLTSSQLKKIVKTIGGITVDVKAPYTAKGYTFEVGPQRFDGDAAAAYATGLAEGEPEQGRLARFEAVIAATFAAMPQSKAEIQAMLVGSELATGSFDPAELASRLTVLRAEATGSGIASTMLPFEPVTVGDTTVTSLDDAGVADVVTTWLGGAKLSESADGPLRVLVQNGVGVPGLSEAARQRLLGAGLRFVAGGNAQSFDYGTTKVLVPSDSVADRARAQRVVTALGVPQAQIVVDPLGSSLAEVIAVIGNDFAGSVTDDGVKPTP